jgi:hypothetical protein
LKNALLRILKPECGQEALPTLRRFAQRSSRNASLWQIGFELLLAARW